MMPLHPAHPMRGRGMWVWNGDVHDAGQLARTLREHGFRWLALKAQEGTTVYKSAQLERYARACREHRLELLLWGYLHGVHPEAEANLAVALCHHHRAAGYIADCEVEYEHARAGTSLRLAHAINHAAPRLALALSSFGRIDYHPAIDWRAFAANRFCFMPQAYACESHELEPRRCIEAARSVWHPGMILPTLATYRGAVAHFTGAQLREQLHGLDVRGFSVWDSQTTSAEQLHQLGRA